MSYSTLTLAKALLNVMCEVDSLHSALHNKPKLRIHMLLDYNRSTRPGSESTARILLPILKEFPDRVRISLFRSPKLKGLMAKLVPPRFNEGWGTWHPKIYGIDSEVMLSG
jgi:CDP-diacylglycerol---glycerol-3-phosphate 3-phosphatidyltransferase